LAAGLVKNEFYDADKVKSLKFKTKTPDGVSFESNMQNGGKNKADVNLNFKDGDMEVRNKLDNKAVFTVDSTMFKVADGVDLGLKFVTPACTETSAALFNTITPSVTYKNADIDVKAALEVAFDKDSAIMPGSGCPKLCLDVIGKVMDDCKAGLQIKDLTKADDALTADLELALVHNCSGMEIQGHFLAKMTKDSMFSPSSLSATVHQTAGTTKLGAEFSLATADKMDVGIKLALSHALTPTSDLKSRVSLNQACTPVLDFAWVQKFDGKTLTLSHNKDGDKTNYGMGCVIEV